MRGDHPALAPLIEPILAHVREGLREWRQEVVIELNPEQGRGERRVLMLRGAELAPALGDAAGVVAVFDDLTLLNRAQRDAAWAEVARRLAHEVKNPLTPIQLAAERLRRRFIGRLPPEETELLDRATHTIVSQVEALKALVNAFGDYARPPQIMARPLLLHTLISEVLDLYENDQRIQLTRHFASADPALRADAGRLRQLLHNLLKNSLEAIGDSRKPHIEVATREIEEGGRTWIELTVADNGPACPKDLMSAGSSRIRPARHAAPGWAWPSPRKSPRNMAATSAPRTARVAVPCSPCVCRAMQFPRCLFKNSATTRC